MQAMSLANGDPGGSARSCPRWFSNRLGQVLIFCCSPFCVPGSLVLSAVAAWTPHVFVQGWVDRSGVRGLCRSPWSDLTLAAHPDWTHPVALKISEVSECSSASRDRRLPEWRARAPHGMKDHGELARQCDLRLPWSCPFCVRLGPVAQSGSAEVSAEDRVRSLVPQPTVTAATSVSIRKASAPRPAARRPLA